MRIFYLQIFIKCASFIYQGEKKAEMSMDHAVDERFIGNARIEGNIALMLDGALNFPTVLKSKIRVGFTVE